MVRIRFQYPYNLKIPVIRIIREHTGLGLREALENVNNEYIDVAEDIAPSLMRDLQARGCTLCTLAMVGDSEMEAIHAQKLEGLQVSFNLILARLYSGRYPLTKIEHLVHELDTFAKSLQE